MSQTLTRIIKHEWKILVADRTLWVIAPLFALLIGYGVYNGSSWMRFQDATLEAAKQEERERFARAKAEVTSIEQGAQSASALCGREQNWAALRAGAARATRGARRRPERSLPVLLQSHLAEQTDVHRERRDREPYESARGPLRSGLRHYLFVPAVDSGLEL